MAERGRLTDLLRTLPAKEDFCEAIADGVQFALHEDHRWLVPIACAAQSEALLPRPCTVVMFDFHHDSLDPHCLAELQTARAKLAVEATVRLCGQHLSSNDDDWLKAGMELGMFGDAVIFGVDNTSDKERFRSYRDHLGCEHAIEMLGRPRDELAYQGDLSDRVRSGGLEQIWNILGWQAGHQVFEFEPGKPKILLSIDLDYFTIPWQDYILPWPDEVFEREFLDVSDYWSTMDWTGRDFLRGLQAKAGLVAICRESACTGGRQKSELILSKLNHWIFDDSLQF